MLELACGTGRISKPLLLEGAQYTGLDIVNKFVEAARIKHKKFRENAVTVHGDMRSFNLNQKFDMIFT